MISIQPLSFKLSWPRCSGILSLVNFFLPHVGLPILASHDFTSSEKLVKNARLDRRH